MPPVAPGSRILDIGAGTGNYSYELACYGYEVTAVEPSRVMRDQGKRHKRLTWIEGAAENLPIDDHSADGIICTLATHHFADLGLAFREMARTVKEEGRIVLFTADPRITFGRCWISEYFQELVEQSCEAQPAREDFQQLFEQQTTRPSVIIPFPLPPDLKDRFFFSGWRTPELYLKEDYRRGFLPWHRHPRNGWIGI
ncbi:class I SAM-dependent methyltransferase [Paenibacillus sp. CC-CFT747]|nr:class I SAM-dependent methyltransferase [Paenibacillus sp. CC-CFT747]